MVKKPKIVKQFSEKKMRSEAITSIYSLISEIPFVKLKYVKSNIRHKTKRDESIVKILVSGEPIKLIIEAKSNGEPRIIRVAATDLKSDLQSIPDSYGIIVPPYLSDASRQICK